MKLSVIIPVLNEKDTIAEILKRVRAVPLDKEILVVDGGSTDGTQQILEEERKNGITVFSDEIRLGKGAAIKRALQYVTGDIVIIQDADLEYDPNEYPALIDPIISGRSNVVYGSRILRGIKVSSPVFYWGGRLVTLIANILYGLKLTDVPTCYKVFRTETIKKIDLDCNNFEFCPEVTAKLAKMGEPILEVPISYVPRATKMKKLKWWDGIVAIWALIKYRFVH